MNVGVPQVEFLSNLYFLLLNVQYSITKMQSLIFLSLFLIFKQSFAAPWKNINIPCIILVLSYWYFLYMISGLCLFRCSYPILWRLHAQTEFSQSTLGSAENVDLFDYYYFFFWLVWFWFWKGFYKVFLCLYYFLDF